MESSVRHSEEFYVRQKAQLELLKRSVLEAQLKMAKSVFRARMSEGEAGDGLHFPDCGGFKSADIPCTPECEMARQILYPKPRKK